MDPNTAARLAALIAALAAITLEDINAIKSAGVLSADEAQNISSLQAATAGIDADTLAQWQQGRADAGLPSV